jgi:hypothetical protein
MWSPYDDEQERKRKESERRLEDERWETDLAGMQRRTERREEKKRLKEKAEAKRRRRAEIKRRKAEIEGERNRPDPRLVSPEGKPLTPGHYNGRDIFIEEFREHDGQPKIWYWHDSDGNRHRFKRDGTGTMGQIIERATAIYQ